MTRTLAHWHHCTCNTFWNTNT